MNFSIEFINNYTRLNVDNLLSVVDFLALRLLPLKETTPNNHKVWSSDQRP
jgi:hypothetical protein